MGGIPHVIELTNLTYDRAKRRVVHFSVYIYLFCREVVWANIVKEFVDGFVQFRSFECGMVKYKFLVALLAIFL